MKETYGIDTLFCDEMYDTFISEGMNATERNKLSDDDFGLPRLRKFPINDKKHVLLAIKFFNYVSDNNRDELAENILKKIDSLKMNKNDIHVGEHNLFYKYFNS